MLKFIVSGLVPIVVLSLFSLDSPSDSLEDREFAVIAYYAGDGQDLDRYRWKSITHVIFSFCHLKGQELAVDDALDSLAIRKLVGLKGDHPDLKVLLSLGGWGGCETCSDVFAMEEGRRVFARSVQQLMDTYGADGIDLDWEYPTISGYPGHAYSEADKDNFTQLVQALRTQLGPDAVLSFAAGGFDRYLDRSVAWKDVMPLVDYVNVMTYDLVGGYSKTTGHHTPLYSNNRQDSSADHAIQRLIAMGISPGKIVIGAAFYGRVWEGVPNMEEGLYQEGTFKSFVPHHRLDSVLAPDNGFVIYRDTMAKAPFAYNKETGEFATFDDTVSIGLKTRYALQNGLGGIMFWQLTDDRKDGGLLRAIAEEVDSE